MACSNLSDTSVLTPRAEPNSVEVGAAGEGSYLNKTTGELGNIEWSIYTLVQTRGTVMFLRNT
eukprot:scaffold4961_cov124-Skeletonema_marinoi.AAC.9